MPFDVEAAKAAGYTDDEIRAYLSSRKAPADPAIRTDVSQPGDRAAAGASAFGQGFTLGFGDELLGAGIAGYQKLRGDPRPVGAVYREARDTARGIDASFREDSPGTSLALNVAGGLAGFAANPALRALGGPGGSYGALAAGGARVGGLAGLGSSDADLSRLTDPNASVLGTLSDAALDTGIGAGSGAALSVALPWLATQGANAFQALAPRIGGSGFSPYGAPINISGQGAAVSPSLIQGQAAQHANAVASASQTPIAGERARLVQRADDLGMWVPPGARYNDDSLRRLDAALGSNPLTSRPFDAGRTQNRETITALLAEKVGLPPGTKEIPPSKWGEAVDAVKDGLESVASRIGQVDLGDDLAGQIRTAKSWEPALKIDEASSLSGSQAMSVRSGLSRLASQLWRKGDQIKAEFVDGIIGQLDDAVERAGGEGTGAAYAQARAPWRFVKLMERSGVYDEATGTVNPAALRQAVRQTDTAGYLRGRDIDGQAGDPLYDALRVTNLGKDIVGDSGTATRLSASLDAPGVLQRMAFQMTASPFVNAYARNGGPVMGSVISPPGTPALVAQRGVLAAGNATNQKRKRK